MNNNIDAIIAFCDNCIGEKIIITQFDEKTIIGKLISSDRLEVLVSKEENFFIVGNEDKKYSSHFSIDPKTIKDVRLVLKELERE